MCTTCGCTSGEARIDGRPMHEHEQEHAHHHPHGGEPHTHVHPDGTMHTHEHADGTLYTHAHADEHAHENAHAPGAQPARRLRIERDILDSNNSQAARNRDRFAAHGIFALNLVSSPGAGKTTLLVETLKRLDGSVPAAVIEGDQQTSRDADRIRATGVRAVQINTGKGCHLDAAQIGHAIEHLAPADDSVLFIENVGNLVCPAAFDLGEAHKVVVLSVTEGDDKPLKYPDMFAAASLMVLAKTDLLPHVSFDVQHAIDCARRLNPAIEVLPVCATRGDGLNEWLAWVGRGAEAARERRRDALARQRRLAAAHG